MFYRDVKGESKNMLLHHVLVKYQEFLLLNKYLLILFLMFYWKINIFLLKHGSLSLIAITNLCTTVHNEFMPQLDKILDLKLFHIHTHLPYKKSRRFICLRSFLLTVIFYKVNMSIHT